MKNIKQKFLTILGGAFLAMASQAQALEIKVAPLALNVKAQVLGFQVQANGAQAILLTGRTAKYIANQAGLGFKKGTQMLVVTGEEVTGLVSSHLVNTAANVGEFVFVNTTEFASDAYSLTLNAVKNGTAVVLNIGESASDAAGLIVTGLFGAAHSSVTMITDAGISILENGVDFIKNILDFLLP
jgi:hypothetical protein